MKIRFLAATVAAASLLPSVNGYAAASKACDRACLLRIDEQFDAALLKHDPSGLPVSSAMKATQNLQPLPLGEGIWQKAAPFTATLRLADSESGEVATVGFFHVDGVGAYFISRLRIVDRKITESEFFYTRRGETIFFNPDDPTSFDARLNTVVPKGQRSSRADLILMADENIQAAAMGGARFEPIKLRRASEVIGGENGYVIPPSVMQQGGPPRMPGTPMPGKIIMERDPGDSEGLSAPQGTDGAQAEERPAPGGPGGPGAGPGRGPGSGRGEVMRERRHPLVDTERGLVLSYFIMGGHPPKPGEKIDWHRYYGQPVIKAGETITIPNRSTYRIFLTKFSGGELVANEQFEHEMAPHVVSGFRDDSTLGPP